MDIQKEKKAIKNLKAFYMEDWNLTEEERDDLDNLVSRIVAVVKTEAQVVPKGFVLVNAESLALHAQSIRMFNNSKEVDDYYEIENHVCAIEAMIEAQEQSHD